MAGEQHPALRISDAERESAVRTLGEHQPVLDDTGVDGRLELLGWAGLGEETEDLSLIHRADGFIAVRLTGEQDACRIWTAHHDLVEERGAIHLGHAHVGDHHGEVGHLA